MPVKGDAESVRLTFQSHHLSGVASVLSGLSLEPMTLSMAVLGWVSSILQTKPELKTVTGELALGGGVLREQG